MSDSHDMKDNESAAAIVAGDPVLSRDLGVALQSLTEIIRDFVSEKSDLIKDIATLSAEVSLLHQTLAIDSAILTKGYNGHPPLMGRVIANEARLDKLEKVIMAIEEVKDLISDLQQSDPVDSRAIMIERLKTIGIIAPGVLALLSQIISHYFK